MDKRRDTRLTAEAKEQKGKVSSLAPTSIDNLSNRVGRRSDLLKVDREDTKEKDLDGSTRSIPKRKDR